MHDYVSREEAIDAILAEPPEAHYPSWYAEIIRNLPAADVEPVRHGWWVYGELDAMGTAVKCSRCSWGLKNADPVLWQNYPAHRFCGACGAKMDGGDEPDAEMHSDDG